MHCILKRMTHSKLRRKNKPDDTFLSATFALPCRRWWASISYFRIFFASGCLFYGTVYGLMTAPIVDIGHPFLFAARIGDRERILNCLAVGVSVNSCSDSGKTALSEALENNHVGLARELLEQD